MRFWQQVLTKLKEKQVVYLLTVIDNQGSSPGRKGFKMMVASDGFIHGSIGGGVMEFNLVEEAKKFLATGNLPIFFKKQIHRGHKQDGSGMICSGEQTIAFHPINQNHIELIEEIVSSLNCNHSGTLVLSNEQFSFSKVNLNDSFYLKINSENNWKYEESIGFKNKLYLIGGGHVSKAVSALFVSLGFYVSVFDNRENINTLSLNETAHHKEIIDFKEIEKYIVEGTSTYVAIMTNTFIEDQLVLSRLLRKEFTYLGILGSKAKLKILWNNLKKNGFTIEELDKVHGPIGLSIKSQTPEEIAVSIAAEVISIMNYEL